MLESGRLITTRLLEGHFAQILPAGRLLREHGADQAPYHDHDRRPARGAGTPFTALA
jgi:hypothetical protein